MASSTSQFNVVTSDADDSRPGWKVPLARLNSAVIQERSEAKEEIHQFMLSGSRQCHAILGDLFCLYAKTGCAGAVEILLDLSQQSHVNVCVMIIVMY